MSAFKGLLLHGGLLVVAAVLALVVWTRSDKPIAEARDEVKVWAGSPDQLQRIEFNGEKRKVTLVAHKDAHGRWYVGMVDRTYQTPKPMPMPKESSADAGAAAAKRGDAGATASKPGDAGAAKPKPPPKPEMVTHHETMHFVSVEAADNLVKSLAPLMAYRSIGKIGKSREKDFGLDKPHGTLEVVIGGKKHTLVFGGTTPGGGDRYAREKETGLVYAIPGEISRNMMFAESRLVEHELHGFKPDDVKSLRVIKGKEHRDLVKMPDKRDAWADAATPTRLDETAGNWLDKLGRLRVMSYVDKPSPPPSPADLVAEVDYYGGSHDKLGRLELYKVPSKKKGEKFDYLARTEYTRWYAKVLQSSAEQVDQDLGSVLKK